MSIKKYKNKTIELFNNIFPCLQRNHKQIQDKPITSTNKGQNDEDFFQTNRITTRWIYKNIKKYGQISLALGQILLFLIIAGSALNYAKTYVLDLSYQVDLTFEQFIAFGFSNLFYAFMYIILLYLPLEVFLFSSTSKNTISKIINFCFGMYLTIIAFLLFINSHKTLHNFIQTNVIYYSITIIIAIFITWKKEKIYKISNIVRITYVIISLFIFLLTDYSTMKATGIGNYNATIMVNKNSFIKDIFDGFYDKNNKYHYKGDYIELKDVKVLSTLGDIAYVELCSENMEMGKTLEKNCKKTIKVEFIKKDIHIIRNGKKQNVTNTENGSDKTNKKDKEENEQDLEKSKENKKEESTTKNN